MKQQSAYIPVPIEERLPEKDGWYVAHTESWDGVTKVRFRDGGWFDYMNDGEEKNVNKNVTHWLEKKDNVFVLTKEELEKEILDFAQWYSGMERHKVERAFQRFKNEQKP